ncbi:MAG: hypothetical protein H6701_11555 [Myxococcales bacterium]|nr:hypothetical protein [Myxococcales bacterium]
MMLIAALAAPLVVPPVEAGEIAVDAFFQDWDGRPTAIAETAASGRRDGSADLTARVQLAFDADRLYLAAQVKDDVFQPGGAGEGDRLFFVFAPEDPAQGPLRRVQIVLNTLEVRPPAVQIDGKPCPGCQTQGTTRRDGWAVEASIPLLQLPLHTQGPLKFAAYVFDADADAQAPEGTITTDPIDADLVPKKVTLRLDPLLALDEGQRAWRNDRGDGGLPLRSIVADVTGDPFPEELRITPRDIVILGRDLPDRAAYLYITHGWRADPEIVRTELSNLDGQPGDELIVEHTEWSVPGEVRVGIVEVFGLHGGYLKRMFAHKTSVEIRGRGRATSSFEVQRAGRDGARPLRVGVATLDGITEANWYDSDPEGVIPARPLPLPWARKAPLDYVLRGDAWQPRK